MKVGKSAVARFLLLVAAGGLLFPMQALPMPNNPTVVAGDASISQSGTEMTITQTTNKAIINWEGYSIDVNELVRYIQPGANAVALNRITGGDPSVILGQLLANGQIFIINPAGVIFGESARVNVAGLLATTLNISDSDFLSSDNYTFTQDPNAALGAIINKGQIVISDNGYAVLVAPLVSNEGLIVANLGKVRIGGAESFTVSFDGQNLINFAISSPVSGTPGTVLIPTDQVTDIIKEVVNIPQLVEAGSIIEEGGSTYLVGASGTVINTGTIRADGATGADAGSIIINSNLVSAIVPGSLLSASGVGANSSGGEVRVLSSGNVAFTPGGVIEAKGGTTGDGGFVEVSAGGHVYLGGTVNTSAENGNFGVYLIDPTTLIVADGSRPGGDTYTGGTFGNFVDDGTTDYIYETELENAISNITLQAAQNITVEDITDDVINIANSGIGISMQTIGTGVISFMDTNDTIQTNGGAISISNPSGTVSLGNLVTSGADVTVLAQSGSVGNIDTSSTTGSGGVVSLTFTGSGTLTTGNINTSSSAASASGGDVTISASNLDVTVGTIDSSPGTGGTAGNILITGQTLTAGDITTGGGTITLPLGGGNGIFSGMSTSGGDITITGGTDYTFDGVIDSSGGAIVVDSDSGTVTINNDISSGAGTITIVGANTISQDSASTITGAGGDITISAEGNITIADIDNTPGTVTITSATGSIVQDGDLDISDITAATIVLSAGDTTQTTGADIDIDVASTNITATADNSITIKNINTANATVSLNSSVEGNISFTQEMNGDVDVTATTNNGSISIYATGVGTDITATNVVAGGSGSYVTIDTATGGGDNIFVDYVEADDIVYINANSSIEEASPDAEADIVTTNLLMISHSGIGAEDTIEIDADTLAVRNASLVEGVYIKDLADGLIIGTIGSQSGIDSDYDVDITTTSPLIVNAPIISDSFISLTAQNSDGYIEVNSSITAVADVSLTAEGVNTSGQSIIMDSTNGSISAGNDVNLTANTVNSGDIIVSSIQAGGNIQIIADNTGGTVGSILDDGDETTLLQAGIGGTVTLIADEDIGANTGTATIPEGYLDIDMTNSPTVDLTGQNAYIRFVNSSGVSSSDLNLIGLTSGIYIGVDNNDFTFNNGTFDGIGLNVGIIANNINLNYAAGNDIDTTGDVSLIAITGSILDNDANVDIIANDLQLTAQTGIYDSSDDYIETSVSSLTATNNISGNVYLDNYSSSLIINGISNTGGGVAVLSSLPGSEIIVNEDVITNAGDIYIAVEDGLTINGDITSNGADIYLVSDWSQDGTGAFVQGTDSTIDAGIGIVDIWLSEDSTFNDIRGAYVFVSFASDASIVDNSSTSVRAYYLMIHGNLLNDLTSNGINLNTAVSSLSIEGFGVGSTGNITITNTGTGVLELVAFVDSAIENPGGSVTITTQSPLTVSAGVYADGNIELTADGFGIDDLTVDADIQSTSGDVTLKANRNVLINSGTISSAGSISITADNDSDNTGMISQSGGQIGTGSESLSASAADGITLGSFAGIFGILSIAEITATNSDSGYIVIDNLGDLQVSGIDNDASDGGITVSALPDGVDNNPDITINGNIQAEGLIYIVSEGDGGSITQQDGTSIVSNGGDIQVVIDSVSSTGQNISISSIDAGTGNVVIGTTGGAIIDNDTTDNVDVIGGTLTLYATEGIGSGNAIDTQVGVLDIYNETGNVAISNTGDLELAVLDIIPGDGYSVYQGDGSGATINIQTASTITITNDILTNGADLTLGATTGIYQNADIITGTGALDTVDAGFYVADAGTGVYSMSTGTSIDTTDPDGNENINITAGDNITITTINAGDAAVSLTSTGASILDDEDDTTAITAGAITLSAAIDIGATDGLSGIRPGFIDIDPTYLTAGSITLAGADGSNIYLNFLGDFQSSYLAYPDGVSPNNSTNSINSLTIGSSGNITVDNEIFNVDDSGNPTGIYYDLYLLATGTLTLSSDIVTNEDILQLATGGSLVLTMANITFNNPDGTLILWADFDQDGIGSLTGGSESSPITLNNVSNLILIAAEGIDIYTIADPINIAAYNSTSGEINIDNVGDITVFDGTSYVGVPGIDVNGINNAAGEDVNITAHSDVNINAPINTFGGDLNITATENITHNEFGDITTSGGTYTGNFDSDNNLTGAYTMADTGLDASVIDVGTGDVYLIGGNIISGFGGEGITVAQIIGDTTSSDIYLVTASGAISETGAETGGYDISGNNLLLVAADGISLDNTRISTLAASNSTSGNIEITNTAAEGLTIGVVGSVAGVTNSGGNVTIVENSPIDIISPVFATGDIILIANDSAGLDDGNITNSGSGTITSSGGNVSLYAGNNINMGADIQAAGTLTMAADDSTMASNNSTGTGSIIYTAGIATGPTMVLSGVAIGSSAASLLVDAGTLTATAGSGNTAGDIYITELNDITLTNVTTYDGVINIVSAGDMNVTNVATGTDNDIYLESTGNDVSITGTVDAGTGNVEIVASGNIGDASGLISASDLTLDAGGNIIIGTNVDRLQARANGAIVISEDDDIELADINGLGYSISNSGSFTTSIEAGGVITISDQITSGAGVNILADGSITQNADIIITEIEKTVTIDGSSFTMGDDVQINTNAAPSTGEIDINADGDIVLGRLISGTVSVESATGSITAANNTTGPEIETGVAMLTAATGIGGSDFDTEIVQLLARVTGTGGIEIHNTNVPTYPLRLELIETADGSVTIDTDGEMIANIIDANGDVILEITGTGDMNVGTILADSGVFLTVNDGEITDNNDALTNVVATGLAAEATSGISLDTSVSLIALSNEEGDIDIFNQGALDITTVGSISGITNIGATGPADITIVNVGGLTIYEPVSIITNGAINLTAFSPVNVNADVSAPGDITIIAGDDDIATNDDITIAANVNIASANEDVTLQAGDDIVQAAGTGVISAGGGDITLIAGHDNDGVGLINIAGKVGSGAENLIMEADQTINARTNVSTLIATTNNDNITITEDNELALNLVNAGTGDVSITVNAGGITDNNADGLNIIATDLILDADTGIGSGDELETQVTNLAARVRTGNGNIEIINTGDLTLDDIITGWGYAVSNNGSGDIIITVNSNLTIEDPVVSNGGDITLTANSGAIIQNPAGDITTSGGEYTANAAGPYTMADGAVVNSGFGLIDISADGDITLGQLISSSTVLLNSGGAILDGGDTGGEDIQATAVELVASTGIGNTNPIETDVLNLAARSTTGPININETNDLTITTVGGTTGITTTGNIDLDVGDELILNTNNDISSNGGNITISAVDVLQNNGADILSSGGDITLTITQLTQFHNSEIDAGTGNVDIDAGGHILLDEISGSTVTIIASGYIEERDAGDPDIDITATDLIMSAESGIGSAGAIETQVSRINAYNSLAGDINITNTGNLTIDDFAGLSGWGVSNNGGAVVINNNGSIDIPGTSGGGVSAEGNVVLTATGNITAGSSGNSITAVESDDGSVNIYAGGDVYLGQIYYADVYAYGDINITATNDITVDNYTYVEATSGNITLDAGRNIDIITRVTGEEDTRVSSYGGAVSLTAGNDVNITGISGTPTEIYGAGNVSITATAGDINVTNGDIETGNMLTMTASSGEVNIVNSSLDSDTGTTITGENILVALSQVDSSDYIDIEATTYDVIVDTSGITSDGGDISLVGEGNVVIDNTSIGTTGTGWITITAETGYVSIDPSTITAVNGAISITSLNGVSILDNTLIQTTGSGAIMVLTYGGIIIDRSTIDAGIGLTMYAFDDVDITGSELNAGTDIIIGADNGAISIISSTLTATIDTTLEADQDIIISADSSSISGRDVNITAGEDIELGYVQAGDEVIMEAGGEIRDNNGDELNILAFSLSMTAADGIGSADALETQVETLEVENTTSGDIWIRNNMTVAGDLEISGAVNGATDGLVRIENGYIRFDNGTLNDIDETTGGDMILSGVVEADGRVVLQTIGSIIDNNEGVDVIAGDTSEMLAFAGTIGTFDGESDGSGYNPVDVQIDGDLFVYAADEENLISVAIDGVVEPKDVLSTYEGLVPPGLILFNGRMNGGGRSPQWFRAVSPSIVMEGNESTFWTEILLKILDSRWTDPAPTYWKMDEELDEAVDYITRK